MSSLSQNASFFIKHLLISFLADLFKSKTGDVSDKYPTDITPAGWTFTIWIVIFIWQGLWVSRLRIDMINIYIHTEILYIYRFTH